MTLPWRRSRGDRTTRRGGEKVSGCAPLAWSHTPARVPCKIPMKEYKTAKECDPESGRILPTRCSFIEKLCRAFRWNVAFAVTQIVVVATHKRRSRGTLPWRRSRGDRTTNAYDRGGDVTPPMSRLYDGGFSFGWLNHQRYFTIFWHCHVGGGADFAEFNVKLSAWRD